MLNLSVGNIISYKNESYKIESFIDINTILIKKDNTTHIIKINEIDDYKTTMNTPQEITQIEDKLFQEAKRRYNIIKPILDNKITTRKEKESYAKKHNIHIATLYEWIKKYKTTNNLFSLLPQYEKRGGKGKSRLPKEVEIIVDTFINEKYLSSQKLSISKLHQEINATLSKNNLPTIAYNTLRNRIAQIDERYLFRVREGKTNYLNKISPSSNHFEVQYPLEIIQIDHTILDIQIVDEKYRKPIGRPYITLAMDIYSRMIYGFYLTLDAPSFYSVGQTLYLGFSPKDKYLKELEIDGKWDIMGIPTTIHLDNAAEFRGEQLRKVCETFGINLDFRPKGSPNYGGHIERVIKTLNLEIHSLQGTTFSNPKEKREYNSEEKAIFTLKELEKYITEWIVNYYHKKPHIGLKGKTPEQKFIEAIKGENNNLPIPLKILTNNELEVARLSLLPYEERTIQKTGVQLFGISYFDESLIPFIKNTPNNKSKPKYIFKYDPKDLSRIYFYNPLLQEYIEIPYKNLEYPKISLWELNIAKEELKKQNHKFYNEYDLFETILKLRKLEEESAQKTKSHRRRKENKNISKPLKEKFVEKKITKSDNSFKPQIKKFEIDFKDN